MGIINIALFIVTMIVAGSYGWGMRGTTIGGEKGAMLPGALLGAFIAVFSGIPIMRENFFVFSALGAVGMYFGGAMSYGETLALSMGSRPAQNMKKGLIALIVKGFLWYGVFGFIFSVGTQLICGEYTLPELIILFVLFPVCMVGGFFLFNKPLDPKNSKFPKIYFSYTRQESWGSLVGAFVLFLVFSIIKKSFFAIIFSCICAVFGALGWLLGQLFHIYAKNYARDGKNAVSRFFAGKYCSPWKIMETVLGAFGGLGAAIGFIVEYDKFEAVTHSLEMNGGLTPLSLSLSRMLIIVWICLICLDMSHYFILNGNSSANDIKKLFLNGVINEEEYKKRVAERNKKNAARYLKFESICEGCEPFIYAGFPFLLISLGDAEAAKFVSFFILYWVVIQEVCFEKLTDKVLGISSKIISTAFGIFIAVSQFTYGITPDFIQTILMYGVFYEAITLFWIIYKHFKNNKHTEGQQPTLSGLVKSATSTVHIYFMLCIAFITLVSFII